MSFQMPWNQRVPNAAKMTPFDQCLHPCDRRANVPEVFISVYLPSQDGKSIAVY
jgi:hypothetical protein